MQVPNATRRRIAELGLPFSVVIHISPAWAALSRPMQVQVHDAAKIAITITGKVYDAESSAPQVNVNVLQNDSHSRTLSDYRGVFRLTFRENLPVIVIFSHIGYKTREIRIDSSAALIFEIALQPDLLEMEAVVVTGTLNPVSKLESSVALTTLSPREVAKRPSRSSAEVVQSIPCFWVQSSAGEGPTEIMIRGFHQEEGSVFLKLMEDGLPVQDEQTIRLTPYQDQSFRIDHTVARLEAVRGGTAAILAGNAPELDNYEAARLCFFDKVSGRRFRRLTQIKSAMISEICVQKSWLRLRCAAHLCVFACAFDFLLGRDSSELVLFMFSKVHIDSSTRVNSNLAKNLSLLLLSCSFRAAINAQTDAFKADERRAYSKDQPVVFERLAPESGATDSRVWRILQDRRGFLWFGAYNGLHRYDGYELKTYTHDPQNSSSISNNSTKAILEDRAGMLWFGTEGGGLDMFDPRTERFVHYRYDANNSQSLSSDRIASLYQDRSVVLWVGTSGGGLNRLVPNDSNVDPGQAIFVRYQYDANDPQSLSNNDNIYSICADPFQPDILWIGTWGCGLNRFDTKTGICRRFQNDPADPHSLSEDKVTRVTADQAGMLWIGTWGGGLNRLLLRAVAGEKANGPAASQFARFKSDPVDPQALTHNNVVSIYEDRTGLLWIGTAGGGVNFYDRDRKAFRHYRHHPLDPNSLSESDIRSVYEDREGGLWVGTQSSGLNQFDRRRQRARRYRHDPANTNSLGDHSVWAIHEDRAGTLWLGTASGLNKLVRGPENEGPAAHFIRYTRKHGLPGDVVDGILEDEQGNLWLNTSQGLSKFNPAAGTFRTYDVHDGLQGNNFNPHVCFKSREGEMFFGGSNGLNAFYPAEIKDNLHAPAIVLTDFQLSNPPVAIGGQSVLYSAINESEPLRLSYKDRVFSFEFAALNYRAPAKNRYRYKLEGFDYNWIQVVGKNRRATYTNLNPGQYTFRVAGSNNDGVWNEEGKSLTITVTPPWWETWWFRGAALVALAMSLASVHLLRTRSIRRRNIELSREIAERERMEEALLQSEEHYRDVVENQTELICRLLPDGTLTFVNDAYCRYFQRSPEALRGQNFLPLLPEEGREPARQFLASITPDHPVATVEHQVLAPNGEIRWQQWTDRGFFDEQGRIIEYQAVGRDITERKRAEEALRRAFEEITQLKEQLQAENIYLREELEPEIKFEKVTGQSPQLKYVLYKVEQVAPTDATVLILGETGTGKEILARAIHERSRRNNRPMIKVDCATLPANLIESELFGHERGAFTGALQKQIGRFELADGGTIFLDEIGELPLELQPKLLRVLQEGEFERLGSSRSQKVEVRVIAATNRNLKEEVRHGRFREDLFYRLDVYTITLPPLRERQQDIPLLVQVFVNEFCAKLGKKIDHIPQRMLHALQQYAWPGNVRELRNVIERAVIICSGTTLRVEIPKIGTLKIHDGRKLEDVERDHILKTLEDTNWRIAGDRGAAVRLGLHPNTLRSRMHRLGIKNHKS